MAAAGPAAASPSGEQDQAGSRGADVARAPGADVADTELRPLLDGLASAAAGEELKRRLKPVLQVGGGWGVWQLHATAAWGFLYP